MELYNGDCLEKLKDLSDNSIDIIIADPPYARFKHLEWDKKIDFEPLWEQLWRVSKPTTPIFLFGDFKFALEIYNSQPKYFKYEIVWNKGTTTTPLLSRKRFGKCTEYILVFYKKQPVYNYAKYHKIIKKNRTYMTKKGVVKWGETVNNYTTKNNYEPRLPCNVIDCSNEIITNYDPNHKKKEKNNMSDAWNGTIFKSFKNKYDPKLPLNIIENEVVFSPMVMGSDNNMYHSKSRKYDPKLPTNIIEEEIIDKYKHLNHRGNKLSGKHNTYDPKLPLNIIDCSNEIISNQTIGTDWCGGKFKKCLDRYEPKLPLNIIKCQAKRNKKIIKTLTEKPQFVLEHLLKYFSNEGDTCLDFCMGSGSMGVACNTLNRKFIGIEKNKEFFEITKKRLTLPNII